MWFLIFDYRIYHWQVDCWNRSKIAITIHNSAKITFTLEDGGYNSIIISSMYLLCISLYLVYHYTYNIGPVCMYPQRIAKTKVQYVRGKKLPNLFDLA